MGGPFGFGGPSLGQGPGAIGPVFLPDGNGKLGVPDRPKKVMHSLEVDSIVYMLLLRLTGVV